MIIGILTDTYGVSFPNLYYSIFLTTRNGFLWVLFWLQSENAWLIMKVK